MRVGCADTRNEEPIHADCIDLIEVEEVHNFSIRGEEDDLFPLQKPNEKVIIK